MGKGFQGRIEGETFSFHDDKYYLCNNEDIGEKVEGRVGNTTETPDKGKL